MTRPSRPEHPEDAAEKGPVVVAIESLAPLGDAVGRQRGGEHDGRVTFVPFAVPGEVIEARVERERSSVSWAALLRIVAGSPDRVAPPCPLFGTCGGCQWQHADRSVQLREKSAIVARALRSSRPVPVVAASPDYGYRERARLVVARSPEGHPIVGYKERRSHRVLDVTRCPLLTERANRALAVARPHLLALRAGVEVRLQEGEEGVGFVWQGGAGLVDDGGSWSSRDAPPVLTVDPGPPPLAVTAGAFAQVGRPGNAALVEAVLREVGPTPRRVVELFAGAGNFTRHVVRRADHVLAADGDAESVERGRRNVPQASWKLQDQVDVRDLEEADTVLVDPPRTGLDPRTLELITRARGRIVYVSCDPQTLARDVARLSEFAITGVTALDLMPQTFHVETVVTLKPRSASPEVW